MSKLQKTWIILIVIVFATVLIGDKILGYFKLSLRNMDFTYSENNKQQNWVSYMSPIAKEVGKRYGIPWQAMVVQTALETSWGKSSLFQKYNNFGGIKAVAGQDYVELPTWEVYNGVKQQINAKFARYPSKYEGLMAYAQFFHKYSRYKAALNYPKDPYKFIEEIRKAGYATDPDYISKLHGMLNKYFTA